ncbi:MAG TPA: tetratricopeptide repeat protein [Longimicrobium sp.]
MLPNSMKYNPAFLDDETLIRTFVARNSDLDRILEVLRENTGVSNQHVLVIGPRGIGKTTLVLRSAAETRIDPILSAAWYPVVFGEETYQVSTPGEFWLEALFHLGEQTGEPRWKQAYEELLQEGDEVRLRARAIAQLMDFADEQGKRLLLIVENLNMLIGAQISENDAWALRQALMNEPRLMLLGTATSRFDAIDDYNQALYELFRIIELQPLEQEETQALWASNTGQKAHINRIRPLQILTGGNPRLIRILSEFAAKTSFRSLMDDLTHLVDAHTEYFKHHLDNLPPQERKVFVVLADLWDPSTARTVAGAARVDVNIASALLKRLTERGAVTAPYKRGRTQFYQVAERMYNVYHLMRRRGPSASRVHAVVRFMVSLYRGEELVQTTRSLVEEARRLTAGQRREHFAAYEAIVQMVGKVQVTQKIVEVTRYAFKTMPDVPASLLKLLNLEVEAAPSSNHSGTGSELALKAYDDALALNPDDAEVWHDRGTVLGLLGRFEEALNSFERALLLSPQMCSAWVNRGVSLSFLDRNAEALESFDRALVLDANATQAWSNRGIILADLARYEEAVDSFEHAIALDSEDADTWFNKGGALANLGRYVEAVEAYDHSLSLHSDMVDAWVNRGKALNSLSSFEEALESFEHALILNSNDPEAWLARGYTLDHMDRHHMALESYDRALALEPENSYGWFMKGNTLRSLERDKEALEAYDRALQLNSQEAAGWFIRGVLLSELGREAAALESYDRGLNLNPNDAGGWVVRGFTLILLGRAEEALGSFERCLALDRADSVVWRGMGDALSDLGRNGDALSSYERALAINPNSSTIWRLRGDALLGLGRKEDAVESYIRASELNADDADAWIRMGTTFAHLGRAQEAFDSFDKALSRYPRSSAILLARGLLHRQFHRMENAEEDFREAIALDLPDSNAKNALVELLFETGRHDDAMHAARQFAGQDGVSPDLLNDLAWAVFVLGYDDDLSEAETWARHAVEELDTNGSFCHTYASILGRQGKWGDALQQATVFLRDERFLSDSLDESIDFLIDAVAVGHQAEVLEIIQSTGQAETFEPLVVAIHYLIGDHVDVATEVAEIARDVVKRIENRRRSAIRGAINQV